jgi:hypothetical protein
MFLSFLVQVFLILQIAATSQKARRKRDLDNIVKRQSDIAIRSARFGTYLRSYEGGRKKNTWFQSYIGSREKLKLGKVGHKYTIKSKRSGSYLRADRPGSMIWWQRRVGSYEKWDFVHLGGTKWALRSEEPYKFSYMRSDRIGKRAYMVTYQRSYEVFEIIML